jgi:hypothetical protein
MSFPTYANTIITFNTPAVAFQDGYGQGRPYVEGDYCMSTVNTPGNYGSIIRFNPLTQNALVPNNGTVHMGVTLFANPWLQKTDGGPFNLIGLDLAEYSEYTNWVNSVSMVGYRQDGSTLTATLAIDRIFDGYGGVNDFQHYNLNWKNLIRVEFHSTCFSMDNIEVLAVPEPATILLLTLGGLILRKKR